MQSTLKVDNPRVRTPMKMQIVHRSPLCNDAPLDTILWWLDEP